MRSRRRPSEASPVRIIDLRCEYLTNPLGLDVLRPRLSWALESPRRAERQAVYRILAASSLEVLAADRGDLWDSGRVRSRQSTHVDYGGKPLRSAQRVYWKVCGWSADGLRSPWSAPAWWETGLIRRRDCRARWIGAPWERDDHPPGPAPYLRKAFRLPAEVVRARAYVCGLGFFELHVNGRRVGEDVLTPNQTDYDRRRLDGLLYPYEDAGRKRVLYMTYDVTGLLKRGGNAVGVILGNGWFNQQARAVEGCMAYGARRLLLQLEIECADGTRRTVVTDGSWQAAPSPILEDQIFTGEVYDARQEKACWSEAQGGGRGWRRARLMRAPAGRLEAQNAPPDRVKETLAPVGIKRLGHGEYEVDFGQEIAGWVALRVRGRRGARVELEYPQKGRNLYILKGGGWENYEPRFTWFGFQRVILRRWPGRLTSASLRARFVHTAVEPVGEFESSNTILSGVHDIFRRCLRGNLHGGVPSDCPHRERLGYTGDAQLVFETAVHVFDMAAFYTQWLTDLRDAQHPRTGYVPNTVPFGGGGGGPAWGAAAVIMPWNFYLYYGDRRLLEQHYGSMRGYLHYLRRWQGRDGIVRMRREGPEPWTNIGEWCAPGEAPPRNFVHTFCLGYCARIVADAAAVLGKAGEARSLRALHRRVCAAFNRHFLDRRAARYGEGPGGAEAFALALGAVPRGMEEAVLDGIVRRRTDERGLHLDTGILGTPLLYEELVKRGRADAAVAMMTQTSYPGYGWWLSQGATTMWERWDGRGSSHNHPMFGGGIHWLYRYLAGLRPEAGRAGYEHALIEPVPAAGLQRVKFALRTLRGRFVVEWRRQGGRLAVDITIPANGTATVRLPGRDPRKVRESGRPLAKAPGVSLACVRGGRVEMRVGSGTYRFRVGSMLKSVDGDANEQAQNRKERSESR